MERKEIVMTLKNSGIIFTKKDKPKLVLPKSLYKKHLPQGDHAFDIGNDTKSWLVVDSIHSGKCIPKDIAKLVNKDLLLRHHQIERDWGADLVTRELSNLLGIPWYEVEIARVAQDIGRFSGDTVKGASHLLRRSTNYPFSDIPRYKKFPLLALYDQISDEMEKELRHKKLRISIHTCDYIDSNGVRPELMLLYTLRDIIFHDENPMPNLPLLPLEIAQQTVDARLIGSLSKELSHLDFQTRHNHPYQLSEGSVEPRLLAWWMAQMLQEEFEKTHLTLSVDTDDISDRNNKNWEYAICWAVLKDTNGRDPDTHIWRHLLIGDLSIRKIDASEDQVVAVCKAFENIRSFYKKHRTQLIKKFWELRRGALAIEVRKDIAMDAKKRKPVVEALAKAIYQYSQLVSEKVSTS